MGSTSQDHQVLSFEKYMSEARILIVDGSFTSRIELRKTLVAFGAITEKISLAKNIKEAQAVLAKSKQHIIFSEFLLEDGNGPILIKGRTDGTLFVLVTSFTTANCAEADQVVFKPYSNQHFRKVLESTVQKVKVVTETNQSIVDGKGLVTIGELERAAQFFEAAKNDPEAFARASKYLEGLKQLKAEQDKQPPSIIQRASSNEVHFKCLMDLFNVYLQNGRMDDAYAVMKDILIHFPDSPDRLTQALNLAVRTFNFPDIEDMFPIFQLLHEKTATLVNHMSCALMVNGHFHLKRKNSPAAIQSFVRGISVGKRLPKLTDYAQERLNRYGMEDKWIEILSASEKEMANNKKAA